MTESFAELFEQSLSNTQLQPGTIVTGQVVEITPDVVIVYAGLKTEGIIPRSQFLAADGSLEVAVGDDVEVALDAVEDGFGTTRLSREKAKRFAAWDQLEKAFEDGDTVRGLINGKVKGGFTVELGSVRAFLPGSWVDVRPVRDTAYLEGKELEFKVIKLDRRRNNVVVSRRAVVEEEYSAEREHLLEKLEEGLELQGVVKNLTDYGAFLDLGGIDGLLHITDMAWRRVKHPSEVVEIGQEVMVKVLKFDRERQRVSLGLKQMGEDPWVNISRRYPEGTRVFGKVTNIADYGCFVEIEEGVEGLVHVSEMDWTNKNVHPSKVVSLGDEVEVMILDIDEERRRISLGIKQCQSNPWDEFSATYKKGDRVSGQIKSITDFGIFIGLDGGIDGLAVDAPTGDIDDDLLVVRIGKLLEHPGQLAAILQSLGQILRVVLDDPAGLLNLAHWLQQLYAVGMNVELLENGLGRRMRAVQAQPQGYLRASEISRDRIEDARAVLKAGEDVEAKFMGVDRKNRTISLSIKAKDMADEQAAIKGYAREAQAGTATLGDILKQQMEEAARED